MSKSRGLAHRIEVDTIVSVLTNCARDSLNMTSISCGCPQIIDVMKRLPDLNWNLTYICTNPSALLSDCRKLPEYRKHISVHRKLQLDEVLESADHPDWDWWFLSQNASVVTSLDIVRSRPDLPWHWWGLVINRNIDLIAYQDEYADKIEESIDKPHILWEINERLLHRKIITINDILATGHKPHCIEFSLDPSDILKHKFEVNWDWRSVACQEQLSLEQIRAHPDIPWDLKEYWRFHPDRASEHYTPDMVPYYRPDLWARFLDCKPEVLKFTRRHMAAFKIQMVWLQAYYNPNHPVCQRRIRRWS